MAAQNIAEDRSQVKPPIPQAARNRRSLQASTAPTASIAMAR